MSHPIYTHVGPCTERYERDIRYGTVWTARELRFILECYAPDRDFDIPFVTTIAPSMLDGLTEAVRYFCNATLQVIGTDHANGRLIVQSPGHS